MDDESSFWEELESKTRNAPAVQAELLQGILSHNSQTEYLRRYGAGDGSPASFSNLPLVEYKDLEQDIQRIADGDASPILCAEPVCQMFISSGTSTGVPKLIPATQKSLEHLLRRPLGLRDGDVCLGFLFARKPSRSKGGLLISPTSSTFISCATEFLRSKLTSPIEILVAPDITQSVYCQLLCGLIRSSEASTIFSALAGTLVEVFGTLEESWEELAEDIRTGTLSGRITNPELRRAMFPVLHADPELAERVSSECSAASWSGIVERLWPNAKCIITVTTGAMKSYVPALRKYAGRIPIVASHYVCTECQIGFNTDPASSEPENTSFTIHPEYAFYEFLPVKTSSGLEQKPVGLGEVELGEEYELVVTTSSGLYRYKLGDVVRVTGFYNSSPRVSFVRRTTSVLDIAGEATGEDELQEAIQRTLHLLPKHEQLVDFTSCKETSPSPGRYIIFWELKTCDDLKEITLESACYLLEASLSERYRRARIKKQINPLELCVVRRNTFKALLQNSIGRGANAMQYKTPRCTSNPEQIDIRSDFLLQVSLQQNSLTSTDSFAENTKKKAR